MESNKKQNKTRPYQYDEMILSSSVSPDKKKKQIAILKDRQLELNRELQSIINDINRLTDEVREAEEGLCNG